MPHTHASSITPETDPHQGAYDHLRHAIEHAAELLPAQGPITVFIHHNTLHAFEHLKFEEGVEKGARVYGCQPYLSEERYREEFARGRIHKDDLEWVLQDDLGDSADVLLGQLGTRYHFRLAMLQYPLRIGLVEELRWFIAETDALMQFRKDAPPEMRQRFIRETERWVMRNLHDGKDGKSVGSSRSIDRRGLQLLADLLEHFGRSSIESWSEETWEAVSLQALWRVCRVGVHGIERSSPAAHAPRRHRDLLLEVTNVDSDNLVNEVLIRFCAAFLDQGVAPWPLPHRDLGFYAAFRSLYGQPVGPPDLWLRPLRAVLRRIDDLGLSPLDSIRESLELLGVPENEWTDYLSSTLLALRGWAGMIHQMELRGDRVAVPAPQGSLVEFLAVRLILDRLALASVARDELGFSDPLHELQPQLQARLARRDGQVDQRAFLVFQLAQVRGWHPAALVRFTKQEWAQIVEEIEAFGSLERRRMFHRAFERRFRIQTLDAMALHASTPRGRVSHPKYQVICCLDEREESFRRHLEEISPQAETFGVAGFFSVAMYYRGAADAHFVPLCPIVIRPQHWVVEDVESDQEKIHQRRAMARKAIGTASRGVHLGSRSLASGALLTAGLGVIASVPLVARVLFPRLTSLVRRSASRFLQPPKATQLRLERSDPTPGEENGHIGFQLDEMVNIAERLLQDIGLINGFARLVAPIGHGSNSLNNPHKSAYDCGACGGNAGGPNARALARILNDPRVRSQLAIRGLEIPADTWFVGGFHNTCNDSVTFFDVDKIPASHQADFAALQADIDETCERNAHERCRRFISAPLNMSFPAARRHVEARSEDLAQTRPECGHASNAICYVGRRQRTRGLFLDRRAFLTSYDPTQDDADANILARILAAAVPVCGGISLEYYFSYVDSPGYGCNTKLPHNVTSLLGVMDGAASDLRTGLPWQMVEIHEPIRLLFVIETLPETMLKLIDRSPAFGQMIRNEWVQLATLSPTSSSIDVFRPGGFERYRPSISELSKAPSSTDWYRGWRENLTFAVIDPTATENGNH